MSFSMTTLLSTPKYRLHSSITKTVYLKSKPIDEENECRCDTGLHFAHIMFAGFFVSLFVFGFTVVSSPGISHCGVVASEVLGNIGML